MSIKQEIVYVVRCDGCGYVLFSHAEQSVAESCDALSTRCRRCIDVAAEIKAAQPHDEGE